MRKIVALLLCFVMIGTSLSLESFAKDSNPPKPKDEPSGVEETSAVIVTNTRSVKELYAQRKFTYSQGKGFAAEYGNNFIDRIKGYNARVIGDNNVKNGADRIIIGRDGSTTLIQTKYYNSASGSIGACFDENTGYFKYLDSHGNPMKIEVPSEQYEEALLIMKNKIEAGKVQGITDPEEANNIVKKGNLSFKQAENLAKAGTVESLTFDAVNGVVVGSVAYGIGTLLEYVILRMNGEERSGAIKTALLDNIYQGVAVCGTYIFVSQFLKTNKGSKLFLPTMEKIAEKLGPKFSKALAESTGKSVAEGTKTAAGKALQANLITDIVILVVFTAPDVIKVFQGRISKTQFVKDFLTTAVTIIIGTAGYLGGSAVGTILAPGVGTTVGGIVGSLIAGVGGSFLVDFVADKISKDDAEKMYDILQNEFVSLCDEYMVSEEEASAIVDALNGEIGKKTYEEMYKSKKPVEYIRGIMEPLFEEEVAKREKISAPSEEEMREALLGTMDGLVFVH